MEKFIDQIEKKLLTRSAMYPEGEQMFVLQPGETKKICAVYFLFDDHQLLYVGQSKDLIQRIKAHKKNGVIPFTKCAYMVIRPASRCGFESYMIWSFKPKYNKAYPPLDEMGRRMYEADQRRGT